MMDQNEFEKKTTYLQPQFALLSFTYALYCDGPFRDREFALWRADNSYRGYLDEYNYTADAREFPAATEKLIVTEVAESGRLDSNGGYLPTREQAWEAVLDLVSEISGRPEYLVSKPSTARRRTTPKSVTTIPAQPAADRPLISCLAVMFLDPERRFRKDLSAFFAQFDLDPRDEQTLRAFAHDSTREFLALGEALTLGPSLVEEMIKPPACW